MTSQPFRVVATASLAAVLCVAGVHADVITWTGAGNGSTWGDELNWDLGLIPNFDDRVVFQTVAGSVSSNLDRTTTDLEVVDVDAAIDMSTATYTVTGLVLLSTGPFSTTSLTLTGAMIVNDTPFVDDVVIGFADDSLSTMTLTNATLTTLSEVLVGDAGAGLLVVETGSSADLFRVFIADDDGSDGDLEVQSAATLTVTTDLITGNSGDGTLLVRTGATASAVTVFAGDDDTGDGTVTVRGTLTSDAMQIGNDGIGLLEVTNAGQVTTGLLSIGQGLLGNGSATISADLSVTGSLLVGNAGTGSLSVLGGGVIDAGLLVLGDDLASSGTATIATGGSLSISGETAVGNIGVGTVDVNGGTLETSRTKIADEIGSTGDVTIGGGGAMWTDTLQIIVGNAGLATATVTSGGTVQTGDTTVGDNLGAAGTIVVNGPGASWTSGSMTIGLLGSGLVDVGAGGVMQVTGAMTAGAGVATIRCEDDGVVNAGSLSLAGDSAVEITLSAATVGPVIDVTGPATIAGSLTVTTAAGFDPQLTSIELVRGSVLNGTFDSMNIPAAASLHYEVDRVLIEFGGTVAGDVNGDGVVDVADVLLILGNWGVCVGCPSDLTGDGVVSVDDLLLVLGNWS